MSSMENPPNTRKVKSLHSLVQVGLIKGVIEAMEQVLKPGGKGKKLPFPQDTFYRCGKGRHQKNKTAKHWTQCAEVVERRGTLRKSVSKLNVPHIHWKFHKLPPVQQGLVNPSTLMTRATCLYSHGQCSTFEKALNQVSYFLWIVKH